MQDIVASVRIRAGLHDLRGGFLDRVAQRCLEIEAILATAGTGKPSPGECRVIVHHAHKTSGVAATFGYPELGDRAQQVEGLFNGLDGPPDWTVARAVIEAMLDEMENALDHDYL